MIATISIRTLRRHDACDLYERVTDLAAHLGREIGDDEEIFFTTWAGITPDVRDLIWALRCITDGARVAVEVARRAADRASVYGVEAKSGIVAMYYANETTDYADDAYIASLAGRAAEASYYAIGASGTAVCAAVYCVESDTESEAASVSAAAEAERAKQRADILELVGM